MQEIITVQCYDNNFVLADWSIASGDWISLSRFIPTECTHQHRNIVSLCREIDPNCPEIYSHCLKIWSYLPNDFHLKSMTLWTMKSLWKFFISTSLCAPSLVLICVLVLVGLQTAEAQRPAFGKCPHLKTVDNFDIQKVGIVWFAVNI